MSEDRVSLDEELDAQLARMRDLLKLMAAESGSVGALGATSAPSADTRPGDRTPERVDKPR